jgi:hypothetical protein
MMSCASSTVQCEGDEDCDEFGAQCYIGSEAQAEYVWAEPCEAPSPSSPPPEGVAGANRCFYEVRFGDESEESGMACASSTVQCEGDEDCVEFGAQCYVGSEAQAEYFWAEPGEAPSNVSCHRLAQIVGQLLLYVSSSVTHQMKKVLFCTKLIVVVCM